MSFLRFLQTRTRTPGAGAQDVFKNLPPALLIWSGSAPLRLPRRKHNICLGHFRVCPPLSLLIHEIFSRPTEERKERRKEGVTAFASGREFSRPPSNESVALCDFGHSGKSGFEPSTNTEWWHNFSIHQGRCSVDCESHFEPPLKTASFHAKKA